MGIESFGNVSPQEDLKSKIRQNEDQRDLLSEKVKSAQNLLNGLETGETHSTMTREEIIEEINQSNNEILRLNEEERKLKQDLNPYK